MSTVQYALMEKSTIVHVSEVQQQLVELIDSSDVVSIDASAVQQVDTAMLQLLFSFKLSLQQKGRNLEWQAVSDAMLNGAKEIGIEHELGIVN